MQLIPHSVTRAVGRSILKTKKNSPHIFFIAGVVGITTSTVMACRATLTLPKTMDECRTDVHDVKEVYADVDIHDSSLERKEYVKDLGHVYLKSSIRIVRLYGPSAVVGVVSIASLTGSHIQLTRRNSALTATLAAVSKAYDQYRQRIKEELGEEREREIYHGITEEKTVSGTKVKVVNPTGYSVYARIFDEGVVNYHKDAEHNRVFLKVQETYANHLLQSRGHVFLNDVYDMIGLERSQAGAIVGWVRDGNGDGFVDFGMFEAAASRFINGLERSVILDFNVDGPIFKLLEKEY